MPINKKWSVYNKEKVKTVPDVCGVYELADSNGNVLYIGEGRLRERLFSHFSNAPEPTPGVSLFRCEKTGSKRRCVERQNALLAEYRRKYGRLPKYNQKSRG